MKFFKTFLIILIIIALSFTLVEAGKKRGGKKMNYSYSQVRVGEVSNSYYYSVSEDNWGYIGTEGVTHIMLLLLNIAVRDITGKEVFIPTTTLQYIWPTTVGAGGIDSGSFANDTWYNVYIIYNPNSGEISGLISTLSTVFPVLPSGYTHFKRVGTVRSASSGNNFIKVAKFGGRFFEYKELVVIKDGSFTTSAWTSVDIESAIPSPAATAKFLFGTNGKILALSESSSGFGGEYFSFQDSSYLNAFGLAGLTERQNWASLIVGMSLSSHNLVYYYTNNANSTLVALGWEE